ncbi:MAG TPA: methyltransferase domain-containing protein [Tepidisphaeraceae bacterium]
MTGQILENEEVRARQSGGTSSNAIYAMALNALRKRLAGGTGRLLDIGCGTGAFQAAVRELGPGYVAEYVGVDIAQYAGFPKGAGFQQADLNQPTWPIEDGVAEVTVSLETIEHVENPRAFFREIVRITKPGGFVLVSTPNQLTWLSLLTLIVKSQYNAFQERQGQYPSHLSALLEIDLLRMAREMGLTEVEVVYSGQGRMPGVRYHWPRWLSRDRRRFSDNLALLGRRAAGN